MSMRHVLKQVEPSDKLRKVHKSLKPGNDTLCHITQRGTKMQTWRKASFHNKKRTIQIQKCSRKWKISKQEKSKKQKQNEVQTRNNERKQEPKAGKTQRENVTGRHRNRTTTEQTNRQEERGRQDLNTQGLREHRWGEVIKSKTWHVRTQCQNKTGNNKTKNS